MFYYIHRFSKTKMWLIVYLVAIVSLLWTRRRVLVSGLTRSAGRGSVRARQWATQADRRVAKGEALGAAWTAVRFVEDIEKGASVLE